MFECLPDDEQLTSRSGRFVLAYDPDGWPRSRTRRPVRSVGARVARDSRSRGAPAGRGHGRALQVKGPESKTIWTSDISAPRAQSLSVNDHGDFELRDDEGVLVLNSRTGPVEAIGIPDAAPVAAIEGERYLVREGKQRRTVTRATDGSLRYSVRSTSGAAIASRCCRDWPSGSTRRARS
ncbi:hypothetical protein NKH77_19165 [Streptomyces sp. M19]